MLPSSGNIVLTGRAYRDGEIDAFQLRAILAWMSPERFNAFETRWRAFNGNRAAYRAYVESI